MSAAKILPPLLTGAAVFFLYLHFGRPGPELKLLFNSTSPVIEFDPARVSLNQQYVFLENTFSTLLEYSAAGELTSGLAETYRWRGAEARFRMRGGIKTIGGVRIDAYDAEFSLKRLFITGKPYSPLCDLLCGRKTLQKLSDHCPGLRVEDEGRTLSMKFGTRKDFLFHSLTDINFAVIPRNSVSTTTLAITDYRNTSGPYYVAADPGDGGWLLAANPFHYRYSPRMPQSVRAVPLKTLINNETALARLGSGEFDYLMNNLVKNAADKISFASGHSGYNVHLTQPVRLLYVVFTPKGLRRLTKEERFFIARKIRLVYLSGRPLYSGPYQFFRLEGALSREQLAEIRLLLEKGKEHSITKQLTAAMLKQYLFRAQDDLSEWLPALSESNPRLPAWTEAAPDFFLNAGDIGFQDDIGLTANYLSLKFFAMSEEAKKKWFGAFISAPSKNARAEMLRELQYRTLKNAEALPVALMPYASLAKKPWNFDYPSMFGGDNLWRLRR